MSLSSPLALVNPSNPRHGAAALAPEDRKQLALRALVRAEPIKDLADQSNVSRKFVYRQAKTASRALDEAFQPPANDDEVLFWLPVTRRTIALVTLVLILRCHSSYRGVVDFLRDVFDYKLSIGTVHNMVVEAVDKARAINRQENLSAIRVGAHDEIFQGEQPVLVGMDPRSTYCYLLAQEQGRDATSWGVHLLDLSARGLNVDHTIADAGKGLRAGQAEAWPGKPCWGDVFHAERDAGKATTYLDNRALGRIGERDKLERKMERAKKRAEGQSVSKELALARQHEALAVQLADDMRLLAGWLHDDILCFNGADASVRRELFDFVVLEMKAREHLAPHRIAPVRTALENQRDDLLAFAEAIDEQIEKIAADNQAPLPQVREAFELLRLPLSSPRRWELDARLWNFLGERYYAIKKGLEKLREVIVRASSMVENLNSRLRCYFFLRREVGPDYLELLRFFLNHHRYPRSRNDARAGKSPAEILAGKTLPHWLEQMGFTLFRQPDHVQSAPMAA